MFACVQLAHMYRVLSSSKFYECQSSGALVLYSSPFPRPVGIEHRLRFRITDHRRLHAHVVIMQGWKHRLAYGGVAEAEADSA